MLSCWRLKRKILRAGIKKIENDVCSSSGGTRDENTVEIWKNLIDDKAKRIFELDSNIEEILMSEESLDEDELMKEFTEQEIFREEIIKMKNEMVFTQNKYVSGKSNNLNLNYPKLELPKFDGNVKNWINFRGQFKKIHKDQKIMQEDKLQYLLQATLKEKVMQPITGKQEKVFDNEDSEGDFDTETHEQRRQTLFNDDYYKNGSKEDIKPSIDTIDEHAAELQPENYDNWIGDTKVEENDAPHCEDNDFNMNAEYDPKATQKEFVDSTRWKKKRKRKSKEERSKMKWKKVGDIVLVEGAGKKRFSWPIRKIEEMYFGKDGACRVVKLKTATGCLIRPLQKLFLLETGKNDEEKKPEQEQEIRKSRYGRILKRRTP